MFFEILQISSIFLLTLPKIDATKLCADNCPANEVFARCTGPSQTTCWNSKIPYNLKCTLGCVCRDGYIRNPNTYECIPVEDCPPEPRSLNYCPANEEYSDCGTACQDTCTIRDQICIEVCVPGCFCKPGYVRSDVTGQCVTEDMCKKCPPGYAVDSKTGKCHFCCEECSDNEEYQHCGTTCEPGCVVNKTRVCPAICVSGCFCKTGYVRDENTRKCIQESSCYECPANEIYACGNAECEKTCGNYKDPCRIRPLMCTRKCYCQEGFVRNENGVCVEIKDCY